jgi:hypothetical protein
MELLTNLFNIKEMKANLLSSQTKIQLFQEEDCQTFTIIMSKL